MSCKKCNPASDTMGDGFLESVKLDCRAQIANAKSKISLYRTSAVGIGDHPDIAEEIRKAALEGAEARDVLAFLESL